MFFLIGVALYYGIATTLLGVPPCVAFQNATSFALWWYVGWSLIIVAIVSAFTAGVVAAETAIMLPGARGAKLLAGLGIGSALSLVLALRLLVWRGALITGVFLLRLGFTCETLSYKYLVIGGGLLLLGIFLKPKSSDE